MFIVPFSKMINNMSHIQYRQTRLSLQLSTGKRITCAADDPAGLAISQRMEAQIRGLRMAQRNVQDSISMIQTAEGAMDSTHSILQRLNELAVQASSGTYTDEDRENINKEAQQLLEELQRISDDTEFNKQPLLDGSRSSSGVYVQDGANAGDGLEIKFDDISVSAIGLDGIDLSTQEGAEEAISKIQDSIKQVASSRASLGAYQNRLEHRLNSLSNYEENLTSAMSRITDMDMAKGMVQYVKNQMLLQVGQAMLAQAMNMERERILSLLQSLG